VNFCASVKHQQNAAAHNAKHRIDHFSTLLTAMPMHKHCSKISVSHYVDGQTEFFQQCKCRKITPATLVDQLIAKNTLFWSVYFG